MHVISILGPTMYQLLDFKMFSSVNTKGLIVMKIVNTLAICAVNKMKNGITLNEGHQPNTGNW